jgi:hypothetical protein
MAGEQNELYGSRLGLYDNVKQAKNIRLHTKRKA